MEMWKESQLKELKLADRIEVAFPILLRFSENLGFNFCDVTVVANDRIKHSNLLQINNFSEHWNQQYEKNNYSEIDPVVAHCNHSMLPIIWNEDLYAKAPELWDALQRQQICHGWSQAFHHEESGRCAILSLARKQRPISPLELYEHFGYLFYVTHHLSDLFTRNLPEEPMKAPEPHLSPRELEV